MVLLLVESLKYVKPPPIMFLLGTSVPPRVQAFLLIAHAQAPRTVGCFLLWNSICTVCTNLYSSQQL